MAISFDAHKPPRPDAEKLRERGDLRDVVTARCRDCLNQWTAPVAVRCPRCRSGQIEIVDQHMVGVPRV